MWARVREDFIDVVVHSHTSCIFKICRASHIQLDSNDAVRCFKGDLIVATVPSPKKREILLWIVFDTGVETAGDDSFSYFIVGRRIGEENVVFRSGINDDLSSRLEHGDRARKGIVEIEELIAKTGFLGG